jgi:hypothetical protein
LLLWIAGGVLTIRARRGELFALAINEQSTWRRRRTIAQRADRGPYGFMKLIPYKNRRWFIGHKDVLRRKFDWWIISYVRE